VLSPFIYGHILNLLKIQKLMKNERRGKAEGIEKERRPCTKCQLASSQLNHHPTQLPNRNMVVSKLTFVLVAYALSF
jgi:hypothetical protein